MKSEVTRMKVYFIPLPSFLKRLLKKVLHQE
ncbi:hypothetical protein MTY_2255 [Moorella thermoacetica Y72]|uniref:Stage V sporulation protein SpoVM n=1 Tax=Moorella thermoacetica Y72 TaxID=1325331 RepID=A0A0S6UGL4_NEOTH|nr:hypothetical protein MTY_2255 [Moorella thermoacetica Y72]